MKTSKANFNRAETLPLSSVDYDCWKKAGARHKRPANAVTPSPRQVTENSEESVLDVLSQQHGDTAEVASSQEVDRLKENSDMGDLSKEKIPELGYFLLENEPLRLLSQSSFMTDLFFYNWRDVSIVSERNSEPLENYTAAGDYEEHAVNLYCLPARRLELTMSEIPLFNGFVDTVPGAEETNPGSDRSDFSCLLGLLKAFPNVVTIQSCQILMMRNQERTYHGNISSFAVMITVAFPLLAPNSHPSSSRRYLVPPARTTPKPLRSELQLIMSIIRSDWGYLDQRMEELKETSADKKMPPNHQTRRRSHYFPARLSFEELCSHMEGSGNAGNSLASDMRGKHLLAQPEKCYLVRNLPREILSERIAPFLKPRSLDALRCTCSFLHGALRGIVPGLRRLRLYEHQITSLSWMRSREIRSMTESDCLKEICAHSDNVLQNSPDGDLHRAMTGGQSTLLRTRNGTWSCRVSQITGAEMKFSEVLNREVARGGLLADEPGLGKTITVLSLILQTFGLTTKLDSCANHEGPTPENIFRVYWKECVPSEYRRKDLLALTNKLAKINRTGKYIRFEETRRKIALGGYDDLGQYAEDVLNEIQAVFPADTKQEEVGMLLKEQFETLMEEYKSKQSRSASRFGAKARPGSSVGVLYEEHERSKLLNSLVKSDGTLLVVPAVLLDHWKDQIEMHVDLSYTTDKIPLIFEYGESSNTDKALQMAIDRAWTKKTHAPCIFIDRAPSKPLPSADFLGAFRIVITSNNRFMYEWKNGSFQEELKRMTEDSGERNLVSAYFNSLDRDGDVCPLLKIHWLRLVVDEGHSMGRQSSSVEFASWISAERRWAMTGTPAKHGALGINQVLALLRFLQHGFFTPRCEGDTHWKQNVAKLWKMNDLSGFFRLRSLLCVLMKRHTKLDIAELPPPLLTRTSVPMSAAEVETYNTISTAVKSNLLLTTLKADAMQDSLLHASNRKHARTALANVRRVCAGFSRVVPTLAENFWKETIYLAGLYGLDETAVARIRNFMHTAEQGGLSDCKCCGLSLSLLLITPCCGDLVCTDCVSTEVDSDDRIRCILCMGKCEVDRLQRFQPGFVFDWLDNLNQSKKVKRSSGEEPSAVGSPASQVAHVDGGSNGGQIILRPHQQRRRTRKQGDGHMCAYDRFSADGKCTLCFMKHDSCNLVDTGRCHVCYRLALKCPEEESKASYLVGRLAALARKRKNASDARPLKAIVYSQFRLNLSLVGDRLLARFGSACVAEYWGKFRTQELRKFAHNDECFCMLLGNDGSEGLDLSFVTHIFFLEEIWDRSRADQAVARAWRMGAQGQVTVETLVAENSVEETMANYERGHQSTSDSTSPKDYETAKTISLLRSLQYMTNFQYFSKRGRSNVSAAASRNMDDSSKPKEFPVSAQQLETVNENWKRSLSATVKNQEQQDAASRPKKKQRVGFST